jgi:hypothetical protein
MMKAAYLTVVPCHDSGEQSGKVPGEFSNRQSSLRS